MRSRALGRVVWERFRAPRIESPMGAQPKPKYRPAVRAADVRGVVERH